MTESDPKSTKTLVTPDEKNADPRTPRSIRFSDSEWTKIEEAAKERGMTAAELVRHAAISLAEDNLPGSNDALTPGHVAQIERMYRGVYLLSTLKRDELLQEGRQDEFDRIWKDARESQAAILDDASD